MKRLIKVLGLASILLAGNGWGQSFGRVLYWRSAEYYMIAPIGDANEDGYNDIIINCPPINICLGGSVVDSIPDVSFKSLDDGDMLAPAGDVNGDGFSDFIIRYSLGDEHHVNLYFGDSLIDTLLDIQFTVNWGTSEFPVNGTLYNFNGDGYDDIIIEKEYNCVRGTLIYFGGSSMDTIPDLIITGTPAREGTDINGNGLCDALIKRGDTVFVYYGGTSPDTIPDWYFTVGNTISDFAKAGDVNKDGYEDVIIGCKSAGTYGKAYIFFGGNPPSTHIIPDITFNGASPDSNFGEHVAYAGDVNGDTFADVLITEKTGAYNYGTSKVYLYYGGNPMDTQSDWETERSWIQYVSTAGDMNNDGYSEFIIARPKSCSVPLILSFAEVWTGHSVGTEEQLSHQKDGGQTVQAWPNPFVQSTVINYQTSDIRPQTIDNNKIQIYDIAGKLVKTFPLNTGNGTISWNGKDNTGRNLPDGAYFCRLNASEVKVTKTSKVTSTGRAQ